MTLDKSLFVSLLLLGIAPAVLHAGEESPHEFSANVTLVSDYLYRGISQTSEHPAVQGGFDYSYTPVGVYVGTWASNVDFAESSEVDVYGGIAGELSNGISWDIGGLYYIYPGSNAQPEEDFFEAYFNTGYTFDMTYEPSLEAGVAWSPDFFGEDDDGVYVYGSLGFSLPWDVGLSFYVGHQDVAGDQLSGPDGFNYTHYSIGLSKSFGPWELAGSWNDADDDCGGQICEAFVVSISSSF